MEDAEPVESWMTQACCEQGAGSFSPRNNKALVFLRGLCFVWCRHQESNPGPTDYKGDALNHKINELRSSVLRHGLDEAAVYVAFIPLITWIFLNLILFWKCRYFSYIDLVVARCDFYFNIPIFRSRVCLHTRAGKENCYLNLDVGIHAIRIDFYLVSID